eukprot:COSAG02_NODE_1382_length_12967_cov_9.151694_16_plen_172_part_00
MGDRGIANQSIEERVSHCGPEAGWRGPHPPRCNCTAAEMENSNRWTGRMELTGFSAMGGGDTHPPAEWQPGYWFSHPAGSECAAGESLSVKSATAGGCTWRRRPQALVLWLADLLVNGSAGGENWEGNGGGQRFDMGRFVHNQLVLGSFLAHRFGGLMSGNKPWDPCELPA